MRLNRLDEKMYIGYNITKSQDGLHATGRDEQYKEELSMEKYVHYGRDVVRQVCVDSSFKDFLKKQGIVYNELPILEKDVLTYTIDGVKKYAIITYPSAIEEYVEDIYITTTIPDDLSWSRLVYDVEAQRRGEPPMNMPTKARVYFDMAYDIVLEKKGVDLEHFFEIDPPKVERKYLDSVLMSYNSSIDDLLALPHEDTPELDEYAEDKAAE